MNLWKRPEGFALVEVMVAGAIGMVVALAMAQMLSSQLRTQGSIKATGEMDEVSSFISALISASGDCTKVLRQDDGTTGTSTTQPPAFVVAPMPTPTPSSGPYKVVIVVERPTTPRSYERYVRGDLGASTGSRIGGLTFTSVAIQNVTPGAATNTFTADLVLTADKNTVGGVAAVGGTEIRRSRKLTLATDAAGTLTSCSEADQWVNETGDTMTGPLVIVSPTPAATQALRIIAPAGVSARMLVNSTSAALGANRIGYELASNNASGGGLFLDGNNGSRLTLRDATSPVFSVFTPPVAAPTPTAEVNGALQIVTTAPVPIMGTALTVGTFNRPHTAVINGDLVTVIGVSSNGGDLRVERNASIGGTFSVVGTTNLATTNINGNLVFPAATGGGVLQNNPASANSFSGSVTFLKDFLVRDGATPIFTILPATREIRIGTDLIPVDIAVRGSISIGAGNITPATANLRNLGTTALYFAGTYSHSSNANVVQPLNPALATSVGTAASPFTNIYGTTLRANSLVCNTGAACMVPASDIRLKRDITDSKLGLDFVESLRPVSYRLKKHPELGVFHGLIAQEVEASLKGTPFAGLVKNKETGMWGLDYTQFVAPLIAAVQELHRKLLTGLDQLEAALKRTAAVESKTAKLERQVTALERENQELKASFDQMRKRLEKLEAQRVPGSK